MAARASYMNLGNVPQEIKRLPKAKDLISSGNMARSVASRLTNIVLVAEFEQDKCLLSCAFVIL